MPKRGIDILLKVKTSEGELKTIAGQRSATLNRSADTLETTNKATGNGFKSFLPGFKEWSVDCDGILMTSDDSIAILEEAYMNGTTLVAQIGDTKDATYGYQGDVIVTDFTIEYPYDDAVTYSLTLQGSGALEEIQE